MYPRKSHSVSAPVTDSVSSHVTNALRKSASKKFSAFTLVELIVVITILAILATIGFLALSGYSQDAKDAAVKANVRSVMSAIAAESALTGNSPRYYVVHEAGAALADGTVAFVDGSPVTLTGGAYGSGGTNYSAGNPDWAKLKLNPEKFRLSSNGLTGGTATILARVAGFGDARAAYDSSLVSVGAVDAALAPTAAGRSRSASFFQVTGVAPATKTVSIVGNFPSPTATQVSSSGATVGLVKAPTGTGALVDGGTSGGNQAPEGATFACGTSTVGTNAYATIMWPDGKCWTKENMRHAPSAGNRYCDNETNCTTYGAFYDWTAATSDLCTQLWTGWALPTDDQWTALTTAGAGADGWTGNKLSGIVSRLPGFRDANDGSFNYEGIAGYWWSSTQNFSNAWVISLNFGTATVDSYHDSKAYGYSVVCLKN